MPCSRVPYYSLLFFHIVRQDPQAFGPCQIGVIAGVDSNPGKFGIIGPIAPVQSFGLHDIENVLQIIADTVGRRILVDSEFTDVHRRPIPGLEV